MFSSPVLVMVISALAKARKLSKKKVTETAQISLDEVVRVSNSNNKRQLVRELKELGYNYEKNMSVLVMKMSYKTNKMVYTKIGFNGFGVIEGKMEGPPLETRKSKKR